MADVITEFSGKKKGRANETKTPKELTPRGRETVPMRVAMEYPLTSTGGAMEGSLRSHQFGVQ